MYCKECGVEIEGAARNCPLCHKSLDDSQIFPDVKSTRRLNNATFSLIYLSCFLAIGVLCLLLNILLTGEPWWSLGVVGVLIYGYVLVAGTILSKRHTATKLFLQTIAVALLTLFLQNLTPNIKWAANYAIPIVLLLGSVTLGVTSLVFKRAGSYIFFLLFIAFSGLIPITYSLISQESVLWPSIACAAGCGGILLVILFWNIFAGKGLLKGELKRKFHI
ncbi:MAG: DUF6320 domain-containing protein [Clostridia bacterium]|nr:DUF6320 domain-containing protein [Clostridia bacterium]